MGSITSSTIPTAFATQFKRCDKCYNELELFEEFNTCGNCNKSYHNNCYRNCYNDYGELNKNENFTTCPNCRGIGCIYIDYY